jgi:hypothetical protein
MIFGKIIKTSSLGMQDYQFLLQLLFFVNSLITRGDTVCRGFNAVAKCCSLDAVGVADLDYVAPLLA